jgi:hypothetical protein
MKVKDWNYLVGRIGGDGRGSSHLFSTIGKSIAIGKGVAGRPWVDITLSCDVIGPGKTEQSVPHTTYILIPRDRLPIGVNQLRFHVNATRVGDTSSDKDIVPPAFSDFTADLEPEEAKPVGRGNRE